MSSKTPQFDRTRLRLQALEHRAHDLSVDSIAPLVAVPVTAPAMREVARRMVQARNNHRASVLMIGAHVLRSGVQRYLIDLLERGYLTCVSTNGAGAIHDYELARIGATTESVSRYIREGQFGLWRETGELNDIIRAGYNEGLGLGEAVGREIERSNLPHREFSIFAACYRLGVPITVHVGIGFDIIHEHPNCDGAATGGASYRDFLAFTAALEMLEGGVVCNFGSAVTAPEVYLKSLAMVRNVARQSGEAIRDFTTLVCDLRQLPRDLGSEPPKSDAAYYFRPLKTMLIRTVADGGRSYYVRGDHADTVPQLWSAIGDAEEKEE